ncbi:MAG: VWA domain-containing protein, partial [Phycisphaerae bacterium]
PIYKIRESRGDRPGQVVVSLANEAEIPNRDFVLRYRLGDDEMGNALLTHSDERGDFFTLILQPPKRIVPDEVVSRELVFVLDTSGSMNGFPIDKAKEVMALAIEHMRPGDTFNLITFAGDTHILWDAPKAATPENIRAAQRFLASRQGGGGTEMMKAINAALVQTRGNRGDDAVRNDEIRTLEALRMLPADGRVVRVLITNDQKNLEAVGLWTWYEQYRQRANLAADSRLIASGKWTTVEGERAFEISRLEVADGARETVTALSWDEIINNAEVVKGARESKILPYPDGYEPPILFQSNALRETDEKVRLSGVMASDIVGVMGKYISGAGMTYLLDPGKTHAIPLADKKYGICTAHPEMHQLSFDATATVEGFVRSSKFGTYFEVTSFAVEQPNNAIRVVCFMTDGYVGNDMAIIDAVKKNAGTTRVFSFGIGNSVNRFLLDEMARKGRGAVEYVSLNANADAAVQKFHERISAPVLTDVQLNFLGMKVSDVYPQQIPDLWSAQPVVVTGRFSGEAKGGVFLRGHTGAGGYKQDIDFDSDAKHAENDAIASVWARAKVDDLMSRDYAAAQQGSFPDDLKKQVVDLGLAYNLMTQFTSFVAVEELSVTTGGESVTVQVPVEMPDGVSHEGVFGETITRGRGQMFSQRVASGIAASPRMEKLTLRRSGSLPLPTPVSGQPSAQNAAKEDRADIAWKHGDDIDRDEREEQKKADPRDKLADVLRDLASKVDSDGDFSSEAVNVRDHRVNLIVVLSTLDDATREELKKLGFTIQTEAVATKLVIGSIDVRKLDELAKLAAVVRVRPVQSGSR